MKFALKSLVAAAAFAAVGLASAATASGGVGEHVFVKDPAGSGRIAELTLLSGTGGLYFSNGTGDSINGIPSGSVGGLVGALNIAKVQLTSIDNAVITEVVRPIGTRSKTDQRANVQIDAAVVRLTADTTSGQFTLVDAFGGAQQFAAPLTGILEGGTARINNLQIDLVNKTVFADVLGNPGTSFENKQTHLALWTITDIAGPTVIPPAALLAAADGNTKPMTDLGFVIESVTPQKLYTVSTTNVLSGLKVTDAGFAFFADALGLTEGSTGFDTLKAVNDKAEGWGAMKSSIRFTAREVPEPSTYALMGLGLVGISLVARRRAK